MADGVSVEEASDVDEKRERTAIKDDDDQGEWNEISLIAS
jgi:hypothetical protein